MNRNKYVCVWILLSSICLSPYSFSAPFEFAKILNGDHRSKEHKLRDQYRHPAEVLEFLEIKPHHKVLEVWPGNGWYSEILAPLLKDEGLFVAATFDLDNLNSKDKRQAFWSKISRSYLEKMSDQALYGKVKFIEFHPPNNVDLMKENSMDYVLVFRSLHVWDENGFLMDGLKAAFESLKPGGILGLIQHRSTPISTNSSSGGEGYLAESYVINAAKQAGFELVAKSEINANALDTKDYPRGVYALPPTLAMGQVERESYLAIGESDRMTLKFRKPEQPSNPLKKK